jgi:putative membrane protein
MKSSQEKLQVNEESRKAWFLIFIKGMMMGAVELIPGVSAGTLALITGVLPRLLAALKNINLKAIITLKNEGFSPCWKYIDGNFLLVLALGLVSGVALLIQAVTFALSFYPIFIWSFFFGLILASAFWLALQIAEWKRLDVIVLFVVGVGFAYYITVASPLYFPLTSSNIFFAGMFAICAMLLPGLSGSFMLMLLGMYAPILQALKALNFEVIGAFMAGAIIGILAFSHVLSFMFKRFPAQVYALLTGIMLGSLNKIWPWKEVTEYRINSHGEQVPMLTQSISPQQFEQLNNIAAQIPSAIICALLGIVAIYLLSHLEGLLSVDLQTEKNELTQGEED